MKTDGASIQSSLPLIEEIAKKCQEFKLDGQQKDANEFLSACLSECNILSSLTKGEIITTFKCECNLYSDNKDNEERFKNIINLAIIGDSVQEIVNTAMNDKNYLKRCSWCQKMTKHETTQKWAILPAVLIITLQRFEHSKFKKVMPSITLLIDGVSYILRAILTHHGKYSHRGHYTTKLCMDNGNLWIKCNDMMVSQDKDVPLDGYIFIYDKRVSNIPFEKSDYTDKNLTTQGKRCHSTSSEDSLKVALFQIYGVVNA